MGPRVREDPVMLLEQQWHGYRRGHQLLASTIQLQSQDQELVDKLSDGSGAPRPGERFAPYFTVYPLPSGQHHVVARTWQDLEAPRSGAVFTRSLFVPSEVWRSMRALRSIFDALADREITSEAASIVAVSSEWPPSFDPNLAELTEVLFLERAGAIAAFGVLGAEDITGRLLEALWPSRRATMAVCTYALGPRSLSDRDFDLVFAPETARPRFAKWEGRRIGSAKKVTSPRHPWTLRIADRIFHDPEPRLQDLDEVGALEANARGDSSALRLALRWEDLKQSASSSPNSILGMLDVLKSLNKRPWDLPYFAALVVGAVAGVATSSANEAWQFVQLLVRKLGSDVPPEVEESIVSATRELATSAPNLIVDSAANGSLLANPTLLLTAVGDGLADLPLQPLSGFLQSCPPFATLPLMAESLPFARATTRALSLHPDQATISSLTSLAISDGDSASKIARGVGQGALSNDVTPLLRAGLANSSPETFALIAQELLGNGGSSRNELLGALVDSSRLSSSESALRSIAIRAPSQSEGDTLLLELVSSSQDADWLIDVLAPEHERLSRLLLQLLGRWSDAKLKELLRSSPTREALTDAVVEHLPASLQSLVRLLKLQPPDRAGMVKLLRTALPRLTKGDRATALMAVVDQLFSLDPDDLSEEIELLFATGDPDAIIVAATAGQLSAVQVGRNIAAIARSAAAERFAARVDLLTYRLVQRGTGNCGQEGYDGWASLLRAALRRNPEALVRSADAALDFSLNRPNEPLGSVVSATFPIVHARLAKKSSIPGIPFNLFTAMYYASVALLTDWDRAKAARHGVVDAFINSSWEPAELLRAGLEAHVPLKILGYLGSKQGGQDYLRRIENSAARYPPPLRAAMKAAIRDFRSKAA